MATDEEKLLVRLEVTQRKFEKQLADAARAADRRTGEMERRFMKANRNIEKSLSRIGTAGAAAFRRVAVAAAAMAGSAAGIAKYADAWTNVENQIRAAEQISGTAARATSEIVDIANEARSGLTETAELYARLLRVSGQLGVSEEEVAQATEIVAKAFKAGGAAASEQAAGILQLSQALSSGVLQGDELRSLRENAPLVAQAIADEFETTIGGLKDLGAEGELTADRVFRALLNAQDGIDAAFARTVPTVADGFRVMNNGLTEFIAGFSDGSGAADGMAQSLANLGGYMSENAEAATRFGAHVREAFSILGEAVDSAISGLGLFGENSRSAGQVAVDAIAAVVQAIVSMVATLNGAASAITQAFMNIVTVVGTSIQATINNVLAGIENMINLITSGIDTLIAKVNAAMSNLPDAVRPGEIGQIGNVSLGRVTAANSLPEVRAVQDAFDEGFRKIDDGYAGIIDRIRQAGDAAVRGVQGPPAPPAGSPAGAAAVAVPVVGSGSGGGGGGSRSPSKVIRDEAEEVEKATEGLMDDFSSTIESGLADLITGAKSFKDVLAGIAADLAGSLAKDAARFLVDGIFGRAGGGPVRAGQPYLVNENTPRSEIFVPSQNGAILNPSQVQRSMQPALSAGAAGFVNVSVGLTDDLQARIVSTSENVSARVTRQGLERYDRTVLPQSVRRIRSDPRRVS